MKKIGAYIIIAIACYVFYLFDSAFNSDNTKNNNKKKSSDKLFDEEAKYLGLDKYEKEECKKSGITPEEWAEENDENYED